MNSLGENATPYVVRDNMADSRFSEYGRPRAVTIRSRNEVARRSYESDSISIDSYEEGIVEDYDRFHDKCEENIHLSSERLVATRKPDCFGGKVFSAKPIPLGGTFSVMLLEKEKAAYYNGCLVSVCEVIHLILCVRSPHTLYNDTMVLFVCVFVINVEYFELSGIRY